MTEKEAKRQVLKNTERMLAIAEGNQKSIFRISNMIDKNIDYISILKDELDSVKQKINDLQSEINRVKTYNNL